MELIEIYGMDGICTFIERRVLIEKVDNEIMDGKTFIPRGNSVINRFIEFLVLNSCNELKNANRDNINKISLELFDVAYVMKLKKNIIGGMDYLLDCIYEKLDEVWDVSIITCSLEVGFDLYNLEISRKIMENLQVFMFYDLCKHFNLHERGILRVLIVLIDHEDIKIMNILDHYEKVIVESYWLGIRLLECSYNPTIYNDGSKVSKMLDMMTKDIEYYESSLAHANAYKFL